jgi:hypothetical protein
LFRKGNENNENNMQHRTEEKTIQQTSPISSPTINQRDSNECGGAKLLRFSIVQNSQNNGENKQQTDLPLVPLFINQTKQIYPRVDTKRKEDGGKQRLSFHGGLVDSVRMKTKLWMSVLGVNAKKRTFTQHCHQY